MLDFPLIVAIEVEEIEFVCSDMSYDEKKERCNVDIHFGCCELCVL